MSQLAQHGIAFPFMSTEWSTSRTPTIAVAGQRIDFLHPPLMTSIEFGIRKQKNES